jgi:hypothetical protein
MRTHISTLFLVLDINFDEYTRTKPTAKTHNDNNINKIQGIQHRGLLLSRTHTGKYKFYSLNTRCTG